MSSSEELAVLVLVEEGDLALVDPFEANSPLYDASIRVNRPGRFLRPRAASPEVRRPPSLVQPLLREVIAPGLARTRPPAVLLLGWSSPTPEWNRWVRRLRPLHEDLWMEVGIRDGVVASTCDFQENAAAVLGLLECWCPETSTFVLPWPSVNIEATITLEDVMILGGLPVLGEPVLPAAPLSSTGKAGVLLGKLEEEYRRLRRQSSISWVSHSNWMGLLTKSVDGDCGDVDDALVHAAFLAMWLSRFVFPGRAVRRGVFHIAARLAAGNMVALAPPVLASIYRDLRVMKQRALSEGVGGEASPIVAWAPFHILQLWAWERFVSLRPEKTPLFLRMEDPRAARWRGLGVERKDLFAVRSALKSPGEFRWRPYADDVDDWGRPSYYRHVGRWFVVNAAGDEEDEDGLQSLIRCLTSGKLQGLDCEEMYAPHRVAMQFGLDQDLPSRIPWNDEGSKRIKLFVPSDLCKPCATERLLSWQREWASARKAEVEKIAEEQIEEARKGQGVLPERKHSSMTLKNSIFPAYTENEAQNEDDCKLMETSRSVEDGKACTKNQFGLGFQRSVEDVVGKRCEDAHERREMQKDGDCKKLETLTSNADEEGYSIDQSKPCFKKNTEILVSEESEYDGIEQLEMFIIQELEKVEPPCRTGKRKLAIDEELEKQKDLEFQREIRQLKAELAELEDKLKQLKGEVFMKDGEPLTL